MMFDWLGRSRGLPAAVAAAARMEAGMAAALADPATRTPDIRGTATMGGMVEGILRGMDAA
jgi:3-isopropylmalate dehydrogenase